MFLVCLVLNEVFLIVCCSTPNQPKGHNFNQKHSTLNLPVNTRLSQPVYGSCKASDLLF